MEQQGNRRIHGSINRFNNSEGIDLALADKFLTEYDVNTLIEKRDEIHQIMGNYQVYYTHCFLGLLISPKLY